MRSWTYFLGRTFERQSVFLLFWPIHSVGGRRSCTRARSHSATLFLKVKRMTNRACVRVRVCFLRNPFVGPPILTGKLLPSSTQVPGLTARNRFYRRLQRGVRRHSEPGARHRAGGLEGQLALQAKTTKSGQPTKVKTKTKWSASKKAKKQTDNIEGEGHFVVEFWKLGRTVLDLSKSLYRTWGVEVDSLPQFLDFSYPHSASWAVVSARPSDSG